MPHPMTAYDWVCVLGYVPLVAGMMFFMFRGLIRWNKKHIRNGRWYL